VPDGSNFQRLGGVPEEGERLSFTFDGEAHVGRRGETVAAALLAAGVTVFRETPRDGRPRAPYCMMGVCFECLVEIDGVPNRQACMVTLEDGMAVRPMHGAREVGSTDGER